jgi:hypothetical protein
LISNGLRSIHCAHSVFYPLWNERFTGCGGAYLRTFAGVDFGLRAGCVGGMAACLDYAPGEGNSLQLGGNRILEPGCGARPVVADSGLGGGTGGEGKNRAGVVGAHP